MKYNILIMRDDSTVVTYRASSAFLKICLFLLFLLIVMTVTGGYASFNCWKEKNKLNAEKISAQNQLKEAQANLQRLQNFDDLLKSEKYNKIEETFTSARHTPGSETPPDNTLDLRKIFAYTDLKSVRITNLQARVYTRKIKVSFYLNNLQKKEVLSGRARIIIITPSGKETEVALKQTSLNFQIQHFKHVISTFALPDTMKAEDVFALKLVVNKKTGELIFSETYPISSIKS